MGVHTRDHATLNGVVDPASPPRRGASPPECRAVSKRGSTTSIAVGSVLPMKTTWTLRHRQSGATMIVSCDGPVLTVSLGERTEQKTLVSADTAWKAADHLVVERSARGFTLLKKEVVADDKPAEEKDPPPTTPAEALAYRLRKRKAEPRPGWRTWAVDEDRFATAALPFVDEALALALAAVEREGVTRPAADTFQIVQDVPSGRAAVVLSSLVKAPRPGLTSLILDTPSQTVTRQADVFWGDLKAVFMALPDLELAWVTGKATLGPLQHARLRHLVLQGNPLAAGALSGLGAASTGLPALARLGLCLATDDVARPETVDALLHVAARDRLPALTTLEIEGVPDVTTFLSALLKTPLCGHLEQLAIAQSGVDDEDAFLDALRAGAERLRGFARLALPLDDISSTALKQARALLPNLVDASETGLFLPTGYLPAKAE
jgi:hypothetical protein